MTRFLVVLTADVEADDPQAALDYATEHLDRFPVRIWRVPDNIDDDPELIEINPKEMS